jgi:hypothetical protein
MEQLAITDTAAEIDMNNTYSYQESTEVSPSSSESLLGSMRDSEINVNNICLHGFLAELCVECVDLRY